MKNMRKLFAMVLAVIMVMSLATTAFAADETGSITIKDAKNVSVAGKTFNAYKILDLELVDGDTTGYIYTVPEAMKNFYNERYSLTGTEGDYDAQVTEKIAAEADMFAFAKAALAAAKAAGITPGTATAAANATSVTISNLPLGYYVIEDVGTATPISALMLDSTAPTVEITIKADAPKLEKDIDGDADTDPDTTGKVDYNNTAIGDKVPYVLTSAVPDMTGYTKYFYVVTDTLSAGLTFNNDVVIKVGDETLTANDDYTVSVTNNADGTTTVKIVFLNFIQYADKAGAAIEITYSATVDTDAVIGVEGNPNKVHLEYSNNPNITPGGENEPDEDDPTGVTPDDETRTYVTELELIKVDEKGNVLTGAEFTLEGTRLNKVVVTKQAYVEDANGTYWLLKDGTYTTTDPSTEGINADAYADVNTKYALKETTEVQTYSETVKITATVGEDGKLTFTGLSEGEYIITEIKAPNGYNLLEKPINVTITWGAPAEGETDCTWTYEGTDVVNSVNVNKVTVVNKAGTELPETGGIGTTMFYVIGGILMLAAVVLLVTKKRMASAE